MSHTTLVRRPHTMALCKVAIWATGMAVTAVGFAAAGVTGLIIAPGAWAAGAIMASIVRDRLTARPSGGVT